VTIASLPMFDLAEARDTTAAVLGTAVGRDVSPWPVFVDHDSLHAHWHDPALVLSQTCGEPLVVEYVDRVDLFGTFDYVVCDEPGLYRSVLVARSDRVQFNGARAVINNIDSLSGSTSLWCGLAALDVQPQPTPLVSGAHVHSIEALRDGRADIAAIDSITWWLLHRYRPHAVSGLVEIGRGPLIPCPPLIGASGSDRAARVAGLVEAARLGEPLGIRGFVPLTMDRYRDLVEPLAGTVRWKFA
jgi:ABC-type phosphate/phosphonate transport system substrate-binding protein